jgi:hypothetical protein
MWKALARKEIRECLWIAAAALAAYLYLVARQTGWDSGVLNLVTDLLGVVRVRVGVEDVPFVSGPGNEMRFVGQFAVVSGLMAVVLGFRQTLGEALHGTYVMLFHLPAQRMHLVYGKLFVGLSMYLLCGTVPILLYGVWAATPGTHASPFYWSMTEPAWIAWFSMTPLYFASFLSGLRPARWYGSRLAPLAACGLPLPVVLVGDLPWWLSGLIVLVADVLLVICIRQVACERDYS